jgi:hypothetical protein
MTNLMTFRLHLLFDILKPIRPHVHGRVSGTRPSQFLFISLKRLHIGLNIMNIIFLLIFSII